jgi:hypothetical protein
MHQGRPRHSGQFGTRKLAFAGGGANSLGPLQQRSTGFLPYPSNRRSLWSKTAPACAAAGAVVNSGNSWEWRIRRHLSTASMQYRPVVGSGSGKPRSRSADHRVSKSETDSPSSSATADFPTSPRAGMRLGRLMARLGRRTDYECRADHRRPATRQCILGEAWPPPRHRRSACSRRIAGSGRICAGWSRPRRAPRPPHQYHYLETATPLQ